MVKIRKFWALVLLIINILGFYLITEYWIVYFAMMGIIGVLILILENMNNWDMNFQSFLGYSVGIFLTGCILVPYKVLGLLFFKEDVENDP